LENGITLPGMTLAKGFRHERNLTAVNTSAQWQTQYEIQSRENGRGVAGAPLVRTVSG
jgi:hypothetical protein